MLIDQFCAQVRAHLLREGLFGQRAEHYIEELREHAELLADQIAAGPSNVSADEAALQQLGAPNVLARQEAVELRSKSWWYRRPKLANLTLYLGATVALAVVEFAILAGFVLIYPEKRIFPPWDGICAYTLSTFFNFAPVFLALYFLLWFGRRFSCGWGALLMMASAVGLACTNLSSSIYYASSEIHPYCMTFRLGPVPSFIQMILEGVFQHQTSLARQFGWDAYTGLGSSLPQILTPIMFVALWWGRSLSRANWELAREGVDRSD